MIRNIIFDCSETLLRFGAIDHLTALIGGDRAAAEKLHYAIFRSEPWHMYDNGQLPEDELEGAILPLLPEADRPVARRYLHEWLNTYSVIDGMPELLDELRSAGYALYLLSDFPPCFRVLPEKFELLNRFDGRVVSYEVGCSKRDGRIFDILLEKYGLNAAECIFIDDLQPLVNKGEAHGIAGIRFAGVDALRSALKERGIL